MRTILTFSVLLLLLTACGSTTVATSLAPVPTRVPALLGQRTTLVPLPQISDLITSITSDNTNYSVNIAVNVQGPIILDTSYCGSIAPLNAWAVDAMGNTVSISGPAPEYCQSPQPLAIPSGSYRIFQQTVQFGLTYTNVTIHGTLKKISADPLAIPPLPVNTLG